MKSEFNKSNQKTHQTTPQKIIQESGSSIWGDFHRDFPMVAIEPFPSVIICRRQIIFPLRSKALRFIAVLPPEGQPLSISSRVEAAMPV